MDVQPLVTWAAPIVAALATCAGQLALNARFKMADEKRDHARAETQAKRDAEAAWRLDVDTHMCDLSRKLDVLNDATQTNMRTTLIHYCEKYLERGWVTPEERASIWDMHKKYAALNANGFIDNYISRVMELPDKEI